MTRRISVAGLTGSGKTTIAQRLAQELKYGYVSGSLLRAQFLGLDHSETPRSFWLSNAEALRADRDRLRAGTAEEIFDNSLKGRFLASEDEVFDVWFLPWLLDFDHSALHIWVEVPLDERVRRVAASGLHPVSDLEQLIVGKDARSRNYASMQYGVDIFLDRSPFDLIVSVGGDAATDKQNDTSLIVAWISRFVSEPPKVQLEDGIKHSLRPGLEVIVQRR